MSSSGSTSQRQIKQSLPALPMWNNVDSLPMSWSERPENRMLVRSCHHPTCNGPGRADSPIDLVAQNSKLFPSVLSICHKRRFLVFPDPSWQNHRILLHFTNKKYRQLPTETVSSPPISYKMPRKSRHFPTLAAHGKMRHGGTRFCQLHLADYIDWHLLLNRKLTHSTHLESGPTNKRIQRMALILMRWATLRLVHCNWVHWLELDMLVANV